MSESSFNSDFLYRYCGEEEFFATLESGVIWATDIFHFNDYTEGKWAFIELVKALSERKYKDDIGLIPYLMNYKIILDRFNVFVYCLSNHSDLLSQWAMYADGGRGYAIGYRKGAFNTSQFTFKSVDLISGLRNPPRSADSPIKPIHEENWSVCEVSYGHKNIIALADKIILLQKQNNPAQYSLQTIHKELIQFCFLTKNPAFSSEAEWRVIQCYENLWGESFMLDVISNRSNAERTPYMKCGLTKLQTKANEAIGQVMLGPKNPIRIKTVEDWLLKNNIRGFNVSRSSATYR